MAIRTRIEPIGREIEVIIDQTLSPKARSRVLAEFAREAIGEAQETNRRALGHVPGHETRVDGRLGAPIDSVKPEGRIDVEFHLLIDVFVFILEELRRLSPVRSGAYRAAHTFFADFHQADPANPPEAREYVFINLQPYARKIETGRIQTRMPPGVYEAAASSARRRFGNVARIRFGYRSTPSGAVGGWAARTGRTSTKYARNRPGARAEWLTRQPAIVITLT